MLVSSPCGFGNVTPKYLPWHREPETPRGTLTQATAPLPSLQVYNPRFPGFASKHVQSPAESEGEMVLDEFPSDKLQLFEGGAHFTPTVCRFCRAGILLKYLFLLVRSAPNKAI